jgi:hypothetical protein
MFICMSYFFKKPILAFSIFFLSAQFLSAQNLSGSHEIDKTQLAQVLQVLDDYMNTFNRKDAKAWQKTYHFPHYRLASGKMSVLKSATLDTTVFIKLQQGGWDYSRWDHRNIIQASADKVHVDTRFSRYRKDGSKIGSYESLYIVTKENGKWGVKFRSSYAE